jgi:hypothetical protein
VDVSNLNIAQGLPPSLRSTGKDLNEFISTTEYDGIEATVLRSPVMAHMFGHYAGNLITALHAPFAGRTLPRVVGDTLLQRGDKGRNRDGLKCAATMREVESATPAMVRLQHRLGRGSLDAVLYPFSGDSREPLDFTESPFKSRSVRLTIETLDRWGIPLDAPADEQMEMARAKMAEYGFDGISLDGLEARKAYPVGPQGDRTERALSGEFISEVIDSGLVKNFRVSVGLGPDLSLDDDLQRVSVQEAEALRNGHFDTTWQSELLGRALGVSMTEGTALRATFVQPASVVFGKDGIKHTEEHIAIANAIRSTRPTM